MLLNNKMNSQRIVFASIIAVLIYMYTRPKIVTEKEEYCAMCAGK